MGNETRNQDGAGPGLTGSVNKIVPEDAGGTPVQDSAGSKGGVAPGQNETGGSVNMTEAIDKAMSKSFDDLPVSQGSVAQNEADRTNRTADRMATGNTPHGGDDPQHRTNGSMTPMPTETGGKGNVGDVPLTDRGPDAA